MPLSTILIVSGIVAAFAVFGIVLAWGEHRTRNIARGESVIDKEGGDDRFKEAA